jgi:teichuronic acid exporter
MKKNKSSSSMLAALGMQLVSKYTNVMIQLIITMVLARILTPEQYGVVAVVTVFTSFFAILADVGISTAIVQYGDLTQADYDALFFFCLLLGIGLAAIFCLLSIPISVIYSNAELIPLCCIASLSVLFNTLNMVPNGILLHERKFDIISLRLVVVSIISSIVAVIMATIGFGSYALVWQSVLSAGLVLIWNWIGTKIKLSNPHFIAPLRRIWRFSIYQAGFSTVNYFARNLDNLLIGAIMGSTQLGYYDKAYKLMGYPINYLTGLFSDVLQPYLSEYQDQKRRLYESWLGICRVLALVGMLVTAVFVCFPSEIVLVMFGDQWAVSVPIVATLGLSVGVQMVNSTSGAIFQSAGRTDQLFKSGIVCTCISLVAILAGVAMRDLALLGLFISLAYFCHLGVTMRLLVVRVLGVNVGEFLRAFLPSVGAAAAAIALATGAGALTAQLSVAINITMRAAACLGGYALVVWVTGEWHAVSVFRDMKRMGLGE